MVRGFTRVYDNKNIAFLELIIFNITFSMFLKKIDCASNLCE